MKAVKGVKVLLGVAGKLPPCPFLPLRCRCTTGVRLWMWMAARWRMWLMVHLWQRCLQGQKGLALNCNHPHQEEEMGYSCRQLPSEGNRGSSVPGTLFIGKFATNVRLRTLLGNFLAWYSPWTITSAVLLPPITFPLHSLLFIKFPLRWAKGIVGIFRNPTWGT